MQGYIYCIKNLVDDKRYIGKTVNITSRFSSHRVKLNEGNHYNLYLQRAWSKHGQGSFSFTVLETIPLTDSRDSRLCERERHWITVFNSGQKETGYNLTEGGDGGTQNAEVRKKMSNSARRRFASPEERQKQKSRRQAYFEENPEFKDTCISNITNPVYRERGHEIFRNRLHTDKDFSKRIAAPLKTPPKPVLQLALDGAVLRRFDSMKDAERWLGKKRAQGNISNCIHGKRNQAYGYKWILANEGGSPI